MLEENKIFIDCFLYPSKYEVSNKGTIRNKKTKKEHEGTEDRKNYKVIHLNKKNYLIHRIIYYSFNIDKIDNFYNKLIEIDHINKRQNENFLSNLREATRAENSYNKNCYKTNKLKIKNICICSNGSYRVALQKGNERIDKKFKTLEQATIYRNEKKNLLFGAFSSID
jgi:hypothetical protein